MNKYLKDPISGFIHSIGVILSVVALVLLIVKAVNPVDPWKIVSFSIFGTALFLLYTASTLYHWISVSGRTESILKRFDQMMIYVLIAATYTPFCLIPLRGPWGWSLFGVIWGLAVFGILWKLFQFKFPNWFSTVYYLFMGWLAVIAIFPSSFILVRDFSTPMASHVSNGPLSQPNPHFKALSTLIMSSEISVIRLAE